jgi:hypothetical protein
MPAPRRSCARRQMTHYLMDLAASVVVVLAIGWFIQCSASEFYVRDALITQNEVYVTISRFTPHNLLASYGATVQRMAQGVAAAHDGSGNTADAVRQAVVSTAMLALNLILAVPLTLAELYQETSGLAAWIVLIGFGMVAAILFAALVYARTSPWRLLRAMALVPLAVSLMFMALQGFMVLMLDSSPRWRPTPWPAPSCARFIGSLSPTRTEASPHHWRTRSCGCWNLAGPDAISRR